MTTDNTSAPTLREVVQKMTPLEKAVTVAHLEAGMDCNGAETLDAMLSDNMTYGDVAEIAQRTGLTKKQVQGVIASLSTKGILSVGNEKPNGQPGVDQVLTDWGVTIGFDLLAEGVEAKATVKPAKADPKPAKDKPAKAAPKTSRKPGADCILFIPLDTQKEPKAGSKRATIIDMLRKPAGTTVEEIAAATGWSRAVASSALWVDVKGGGWGVERREGRLHLLPEGVK